MIAHLKGTILSKDADSLVVAVAGIGLQVYVPSPLVGELRPGESASLHTHLVVREDSLTLYGFENLEQKEYFELLLSVSGIGPRLALAALSTLNPEAIRRAVFQEQAAVFNRIPGVGKKTAQKILFHLQDRIEAVDHLATVTTMTDTDTEVLEALVSLGYSVVEAQAALQTIPRDASQEVEERLRLALQYFS